MNPGNPDILGYRSQLWPYVCLFLTIVKGLQFFIAKYLVEFEWDHP